MNRKEARERAEGRCWRVIGNLGGNRTCPILVETTSCRECQVIAIAADDLLARVSAPEVTVFRASRADAPPRTTRPVQSVSERLTLVVFDLGAQALAVDVNRVVEVGIPRPVRRVPHRAREAFLGLVNVLGKLEPCFSLAHVLGLEPAAAGAEQRLIVIGEPRHRCAFFADRVSLQDVDLRAVGEPPATITEALDTHVRGILRLSGRSCAWLDVDRLITTLERSLA